MTVFKIIIADSMWFQVMENIMKTNNTYTVIMWYFELVKISIISRFLSFLYVLKECMKYNEKVIIIYQKVKKH